jgi:hypothetical protein
MKIRGHFMVRNFKIEATKISLKKLEILIEEWTNKNIHFFENISQSQWFTKKIATSKRLLPQCFE